MEVTQTPPTQLTLEEPEEITVPVIVPTRRAGSAKYDTKDRSYHIETPGFTVVGTEKVLAVYRIPVKAERWGLAHAPTGSVIFAKFRCREEAEEFGSWMWLNATHRGVLKSASVLEVADAFGPRVRSRATGGKVLHGGRAARARALGTNREITETERLLQERNAELRNLIAEAKIEHSQRVKGINDKEALLAQRLNEIGVRIASIEKRSDDLADHERTITRQEINVRDAQNALNAERIAFNREEESLRRVRDELARSIRGCLDPSEDVPVLRALRGVRIRGETMDEPAF
jgi:hypothetical protein